MKRAESGDEQDAEALALWLLAEQKWKIGNLISGFASMHGYAHEQMVKRNEIARESADLRDEFATARINWEQEKESLLEEIEDYKDLLQSIWLYVKWYYVTKQLTTEQKEMWADAIDEKGDPEDEGRIAERWWEK